MTSAGAGAGEGGHPAPNARRPWGPREVRALRHYLSRTQAEMAQELGVRQQTVSEWETGAYGPRGASVTLLNLVAERAGFEYRAGAGPGEGDEEGAPARPSGPAPEGAGPLWAPPGQALMSPVGSPPHDLSPFSRGAQG